ncbi:hypothetical protein IWX90DRAFT_481874 [Phyllosticta citrichinensis]|uniref:Uncharacterized protein n=1 Tax=Phyllosticta citrichinensis TaxID=1130410 RepID=A0ABR1XEU7_9PEZI
MATSSRLQPAPVFLRGGIRSTINLNRVGMYFCKNYETSPSRNRDSSIEALLLSNDHPPPSCVVASPSSSSTLVPHTWSYTPCATVPWLVQDEALGGTNVRPFHRVGAEHQLLVDRPSRGRLLAPFAQRSSSLGSRWSRSKRFALNHRTRTRELPNSQRDGLLIVSSNKAADIGFVRISAKVIWWGYDTLNAAYTCPFCLLEHRQTFPFWGQLPRTYTSELTAYDGSQIAHRFEFQLLFSEEKNALWYRINKAAARFEGLDKDLSLAEPPSELNELESHTQTLSIAEDSHSQFGAMKWSDAIDKKQFEHVLNESRRGNCGTSRNIWILRVMLRSYFAE